MEANSQISSGLQDVLYGLGWDGYEPELGGTRHALQLGSWKITLKLLVKGAPGSLEPPVMTGLSRFNCHFTFLQKQCFLDCREHKLYCLTIALFTEAHTTYLRFCPPFQLLRWFCQGLVYDTSELA